MGKKIIKKCTILALCLCMLTGAMASPAYAAGRRGQEPETGMSVLLEGFARFIEECFNFKDLVIMPPHAGSHERDRFKRFQYKSLKGEDLKECEDALSTYLSGKGLELESVIKALDVKPVDKRGRKVEDGRERQVSVKCPYAKTDSLHLYHIKGTSVEELPFTLKKGMLSFSSSSFSPFLLAKVKEAKKMQLDVTVDNKAVYTRQSLFTEHAGDFGYRAGFKAVLTGNEEAEEVDIEKVSFEPHTAPEGEGPFDVTFTYEDENGIYTDTVTMEAVYADPVMSISGASRAAGYGGNVNAVSLTKIVFTDTKEPDDDQCAAKYYIGQEECHAVTAYRLTGQEDTLYITSGRPGVKVIHPGGIDPINTGYITELDCRGLDTSRCTTTRLFWANGGAFQNGVQKINYSGCDFSGVSSLSSAFNSFSALQELDLSGCDFSNVENMSYMCYCDKNLKKVDLTGAKFGDDMLIDLSWAFGETGIEEIDLTALRTSSVTNIEGMFCKDKYLRYADLSACDFSMVKNARFLFQECGELEAVDLHESGMPSLEDSICQMFDSCRKLRDIDLSGLDFSKVSNVFRAFYRCESLRTTLNIDASLFDTSYGYTFANMATGDDADVTVVCTKADRDKLEGQKMIWSTNAQKPLHVTYVITDGEDTDTSENGAYGAFEGLSEGPQTEATAPAEDIEISEEELTDIEE